MKNRELIENKDPYTLSISYPDIVNYLVFRPSTYSADDMKAYKSFETYNHIIEGWVKDVKVK